MNDSPLVANVTCMKNNKPLVALVVVTLHPRVSVHDCILPNSFDSLSA